MGYSPLPFGGLLETGLTDITSLQIRNALVYDHSFKEKHRLVAQLGIESYAVKTKGNSTARYGYLYNRGETFVNPPMTYYSPTLQSEELSDLA